MTELRTLSAECEFDNLRDSLKKDMIICGVADRALRERMLRELKIDLKKAIELGQAAEQTKQHAKQLTTQVDRSLNKISHSKRKGRKQSIAGAASNETEDQHFKGKQSEMIKHCKFCAGSHARGRCLAYGKNAIDVTATIIMPNVAQKELKKLKKKVVMNLLTLHLILNSTLVQ